MNLTLSTGKDYHFDSANASKARLGYRLITRTSKISRIYTGLALQYEHTSDAVGIYKGRRTPNAGNHGASSMLELGWMIRPNRDNIWMLDFIFFSFYRPAVAIETPNIAIMDLGTVGVALKLFFHFNDVREIVIVKYRISPRLLFIVSQKNPSPQS